MSALPTSRHSQWLGVAIAIAFRVFAYGIFTATFIWLSSPISLPLTPTTLFIGMLGAPFWVPFTAGYLSAYFWRYLPVQKYAHIIRTSTIVWAALSVVLAVGAYASNLLYGSAAMVLVWICLDVTFYPSGVKHGSKFWKGRLGRQFLGDFSTPDDEDF